MSKGKQWNSSRKGGSLHTGEVVTVPNGLSEIWKQRDGARAPGREVIPTLCPATRSLKSRDSGRQPWKGVRRTRLPDEYTEPRDFLCSQSSVCDPPEKEVFALGCRAALGPCCLWLFVPGIMTGLLPPPACLVLLLSG